MDSARFGSSTTAQRPKRQCHAPVESEAKEETSLDIILVRQFHTYSDPERDPRKHTITTVYIAKAEGIPVAQDDADDIDIFTREEIDFPLAFDHRKILDDYFTGLRKKNGKKN